MRIGVVATRLAGVDGVTFEAAKWETVLAQLGHSVYLCAGEVDALRPNARLVPAMHFTYPQAARVTAAAFDPDSDADAVRAEINRLARLLTPVLLDWVAAHHIDALVVENAWAIPMQLPLGVALRRVVEETGIPAIGHHHDYWWERERFAGCIVPGGPRGGVPARSAVDPPRQHQLACGRRAEAPPRHRVEGHPERLRLRQPAAQAVSRPSVAACGTSSA